VSASTRILVSLALGLGSCILHSLAELPSLNFLPEVIEPIGGFGSMQFA